MNLQNAGIPYTFRPTDTNCPDSVPGKRALTAMHGRRIRHGRVWEIPDGIPSLPGFLTDRDTGADSCGFRILPGPFPALVIRR